MTPNFSPERNQAAREAAQRAAAKRAENLEIPKPEETPETEQEKVEAGKAAQEFLNELEKGQDK